MNVVKIVTVVGLSAALLFVGSCKPKAEASSEMNPTTFGKTADGKQALLYVLKNKSGMQAAITNYGATLVSLKTPDRQGKFADVILGYDNVPGYENGKAYFGGTVGRYANRIGKSQFTLDGTTYKLAVNDGANSLHGGLKGFNKVFWDAKLLSPTSLQLHYLSKDGEEGYPGNLSVLVTYTLTDNNELKIDYLATTDKDTVLNLTNHAYFNLTGDPKNDVLQHQLTLYASRFTPIDSTLIPTGEIRSVKNTPLDFTTDTAIGARINQDDEQLKLAKGYDHNFVIDRSSDGSVKAAEVYEPTSGRVLDVYTDQPGIQFYTGNFLNGTEKGKGGQAYNYRTAFCLETQHFPDSPNKPDFPSTELKPGQQYRSTTVYKFSAR